MARPVPACAATESAASPDPTEYLPLAAAARLLPSARAARPAPTTLWRWSARGLVAADGTRVRLRTAVLGGTTVTTRRWLSEFADALAAARDRARADQDRPRRRATAATLRRAGIAHGGRR